MHACIHACKRPALRRTQPYETQSHERSPWRVFVREERETKTAKSRLMELNSLSD